MRSCERGQLYSEAGKSLEKTSYVGVCGVCGGVCVCVCVCGGGGGGKCVGEVSVCGGEGG